MLFIFPEKNNEELDALSHTNTKQHPTLVNRFPLLYSFCMPTTSKKLDEKLLLEEIFVSSIDNNFIYVDSFLRDS